MESAPQKNPLNSSRKFDSSFFPAPQPSAEDSSPAAEANKLRKKAKDLLQGAPIFPITEPNEAKQIEQRIKQIRFAQLQAHLQQWEQESTAIAVGKYSDQQDWEFNLSTLPSICHFVQNNHLYSSMVRADALREQFQEQLPEIKGPDKPCNGIGSTSIIVGGWSNYNTFHLSPNEHDINSKKDDICAFWLGMKDFNIRHTIGIGHCIPSAEPYYSLATLDPLEHLPAFLDYTGDADNTIREDTADPAIKKLQHIHLDSHGTRHNIVIFSQRIFTVEGGKTNGFAIAMKDDDLEPYQATSATIKIHDNTPVIIPTRAEIEFLYDMFRNLDRPGGGQMYVHCFQGVGRSATFVLAYLKFVSLAFTNELTSNYIPHFPKNNNIFDEIAWMRTYRPGSILTPEQAACYATLAAQFLLVHADRLEFKPATALVIRPVNRKAHSRHARAAAGFSSAPEPTSPLRSTPAPSPSTPALVGSSPPPMVSMFSQPSRMASPPPLALSANEQTPLLGQKEKTSIQETHESSATCCANFIATINQCFGR